MRFRTLLAKHALFFRHVRPYRPQLALIAVIFFGQIWLNVQVPIPAKKMVNDLFPKSADAAYRLQLWGIDFGENTVGHSLLLLALLLVAIGVATVLLGALEAFATSEVVFRFQRNLRRELFGQLFTRQQPFMDSKRKVDLTGRVSGDVENLDIFFSNGFSAVVRDVPMIATLVIMMFSINQKLTLIFIAILAAYYVVMDFFTKRNRVASKDFRRSLVTYEQDSYQALSSMAVAKSLRGEAKLQASLMDRIATLIVNARRQRNYVVGLDVGVGSLNFATKGVMFFFGGWAIFRGEVKLGDLVQLIAYMGIVERHINSINKFTTKFPKALASLDRISEMANEMALHPESSGPIHAGAAARQSPAEALRFEDVDFHHDEHKPLLRRFSLSLGERGLVAVAGTSGAGKSSFARLLNRLNDPASGRILLGGIDLRQLELGSLRDHVRVLSQETFLVAGTIRDNLQLAARHPFHDDQLWDALRSVHAEGFVRELPLGLDTLVGEGGQQLSGGQAKRLHVARAFLDTESDILLLDEPTSGLDAQSAEIVMASVKRLAEKKSLVLWVSHQAAEIARAESVLFFCAGRNPVLSTHQELYRNNAAYRALLQAGEGSPETETETAAELTLATV